MHFKLKPLWLMGLLCLVVTAACKKADTINTSSDSLSAEILNDFSTKVVFANYTDLYTQASQLDININTFLQNPDANGLSNCRNTWISTRQAWERSESFLFGPVETENMDPDIDDWPVSQVDLDSLLNGGSSITKDYIDKLPTTLKGFHAIEYVLYGANGQKKVTEFTTREKSYLKGLSANLLSVTLKMKNTWDLSLSDNFARQVISAGAGSSTYTTQKAAYIEIINAMTGIVEEVGEEKLNTPFVNRDSTLEESHFSKNSFKDFTDNIRGVKNVYMGIYTIQGKGLNLYVNSLSKSLDAKIQLQIDNAINVLSQFSIPFGTAITRQSAAIQNAQKVLGDLKTTLDTELLPLIQKNLKK